MYVDTPARSRARMPFFAHQVVFERATEAGCCQNAAFCTSGAREGRILKGTDLRLLFLLLLVTFYRSAFAFRSIHIGAVCTRSWISVLFINEQDKIRPNWVKEILRIQRTWFRYLLARGNNAGLPS